MKQTHGTGWYKALAAGASRKALSSCETMGTDFIEEAVSDRVPTEDKMGQGTQG